MAAGRKGASRPGGGHLDGRCTPVDPRCTPTARLGVAAIEPALAGRSPGRDRPTRGSDENVHEQGKRLSGAPHERVAAGAWPHHETTSIARRAGAYERHENELRSPGGGRRRRGDPRHWQHVTRTEWRRRLLLLAAVDSHTA